MSGRAESRFKPWVWLAAVTVLILPCSLLTGAQAQPTGTLETVFSSNDLAALERLATTAQANSPEVLEARHAFELAAADVEPLGRLTQALDVRAGANLAGNIYSQASPSYSISVSLDVVSLLEVPDEREVLESYLAQAQAQTRVQVVQAFTGYVVARNTAESAAQALESAEAQFRVTTSRLEVQEVTLNDQISARSLVGSAAVSLLSANANVIITLEQLAAVVGLTAKQTLAVVAEAQLVEQ